MNKCATLDAIRTKTLQAGIEVVQARFKRYSFSPHRHDDYVIGVTDIGEQRFTYRGAERCARPGQVFVIHPDELHDGRPGTVEGYSYRALYLRPALISQTLQKKQIPFARHVVYDCPRLRLAVEQILSAALIPNEDLGRVEQLTTLAELLFEQSGQSIAPQHSLDWVSMNRIKEQIDANPASRILMKDLETSCGVSRYKITRQFKRCFGTTPHRYLMMRRLDYAKSRLLAGDSIVSVAGDSGFADQSHLTRHFRSSFGVSPHAWVHMSRSNK